MSSPSPGAKRKSQPKISSFFAKAPKKAKTAAPVAKPPPPPAAVDLTGDDLRDASMDFAMLLCDVL